MDMRLPHVSMRYVMSLVSCTNWQDGHCHINCKLSAITKILLVLDRQHNGDTFRDMAIVYGVSHQTVWRIYNDTNRLLQIAFN